MSGLEAFIDLFGDITILNVVWFILALAFIITIFVQIFRFLSRKIKEHDAREAEWQQTVESTKRYQGYREQSLKIQEGFKKEIEELKNIFAELHNEVELQKQHIESIENSNKKRERNKIRDILLQYYKTYADVANNPSRSWTKMESDTFWELFGDYEELDGDGHMHTVVEPAMRLLDVVADPPTGGYTAPSIYPNNQ